MKPLIFAFALAAAAASALAQEAPISAQRLSDITRELSSDAYAGRAPGGVAPGSDMPAPPTV